MTKEQYDDCKQWETIFDRAVKMDFLHITNTVFQKIAEMYYAVFNEGLSRSQMNCNSCRLRAVKRLGNEYFQNKDKYEAPKKKVGRPKKLDLDSSLI